MWYKSPILIEKRDLRCAAVSAVLISISFYPLCHWLYRLSRRWPFTASCVNALETVAVHMHGWLATGAAHPLQPASSLFASITVVVLPTAVLRIGLTMEPDSGISFSLRSHAKFRTKKHSPPLAPLCVSCSRYNKPQPESKPARTT